VVPAGGVVPIVLVVPGAVLVTEGRVAPLLGTVPNVALEEPAVPPTTPVPGVMPRVSGMVVSGLTVAEVFASTDVGGVVVPAGFVAIVPVPVVVPLVVALAALGSLAVAGEVLTADPEPAAEPAGLAPDAPAPAAPPAPAPAPDCAEAFTSHRPALSPAIIKVLRVFMSASSLEILARRKRRRLCTRQTEGDTLCSRAACGPAPLRVLPNARRAAQRPAVHA
jgi:hypothetical protein